MAQLLAMLTLLFLLPGSTPAGPGGGIPNWTAPPFWTPPPAAEEPAGVRGAYSTEALPSAPLPFVAVSPCRLADTRGNGFSGAFGPPRLVANVERTFPIAGTCGIPTGAQAVSANVTVVFPVAGPGYLAFYPSGTTWTGVSNINFMAGAVIANTAIVPLGSDGGMTVQGNVATHLIIDVNGYYAAASLVSSLNGLTGNVTLAQGSNVTITPTGNTLTIAASGGGGGSLPAGATGQTLRHDGAAWVASSALLNNGTSMYATGSLFVGGTLALPALGTGRIDFGTTPVVHGGADGLETYVGADAGNMSGTGTSNTGIGRNALQSVTTGKDNVAVGNHSGTDNTKGSGNTAVGLYSLLANTTASGNVAVGTSALERQAYDNSSTEWISENTAVGYAALASVNATSTSNGIQNTAVGAHALERQTTGAFNVAVGHGALYSGTTGSQNVALGRGALWAGTTGTDNTAVGDFALRGNSTGSRNTAVGSQALFTQSFDNGGTEWSAENTAVGHRALYSTQPTASSNGYRNTAVGMDALYLNTTGSQNVALGHTALLHNETGWANVAIGYDALSDNVSGTQNVAIGRWAGLGETGSHRLHIGSAYGTLIYGQFDTARVGIDATDPTVALDVNGQVRTRTISSASASTSVCFSATGVLGTCTSDLRLKKNVMRLEEEVDVLAALSCLHGVAYEWDTAQERARDLGDRREIGLVAQEVEVALPQVVSTAPDGYKSLDYARLSAFLVEVARAQQKEIAALRDLVGRQEARIRNLEVPRSVTQIK